MTVKVLVPTPLQKFTNNQATIECNGGNIDELIDALETNCPGIKARICDETGKPRRFLNLYVNSEDIRFLGEVGVVANLFFAYVYLLIPSLLLLLRNGTSLLLVIEVNTI